MIDISTHLVNKYVAFIDVLGFSDLVNSNKKNLLNDYFNSIERVKEFFKDKKSKIELFSISDSIILIGEDSPEDFKQLLIAIRSLQAYLVDKKIWVRGGVSFGEVAYIKDKNIIVGQGYIKAFKLESLAIVPRVIIDPIIIKNNYTNLKDFIHNLNYENRKELPLKLIHEYGEEKYRRTIDDAIFIDYVGRILVECNLDRQKGPEDKRLEDIYENIKQNLYSKQELYHKYLWVKKYFSEILIDLKREESHKSEVKSGAFYYYEKWFERFQEM